MIYSWNIERLKRGRTPATLTHDGRRLSAANIEKRFPGKRALFLHSKPPALRTQGIRGRSFAEEESIPK
jgi:hypothetical protein